MFQERLQRGPFGINHEVRNHRDEPIKEELAGDEERVVALRGWDDEQTIPSPAETSRKGKQVASWSEVEHEMPIQFNDCHTHYCKQTPDYLNALETLFAIESGDEQGGKQRAEADNERRVCGRGVVHRGILCQEIKRASCQPKPEHDEFVLPIIGEPTERTSKSSKAQEKRVGNDEPQREYHSRRESRQQQEFRDDKR